MHRDNLIEIGNVLRKGGNFDDIKELLATHDGSLPNLLSWLQRRGQIDCDGNPTGIILHFDSDDKLMLKVCDLVTKDDLDVLIISTFLVENYGSETVQDYLSTKKIDDTILKKIHSFL